MPIFGFDRVDIPVTESIGSMNILGCGIAYGEKNFISSYHSHPDYYELIYIKNGDGYVRFNNHTVSVKAGYLLIYQTKELHQEIFHKSIESPILYYIDFALQDTILNTLVLPHNEWHSDIYFCIDTIFSEQKHQKEYSCEISNMMLKSLISILIREEHTKLFFENHKSVAVQAAIYIKNNYKKNLTLDDISDVLHITKSCLSHNFRKEMNKTVLKYIHRVRIEHAIELLFTSDLSMQEISFEVGYYNYNNFNKWFREIVGVTPSEFMLTSGGNEFSDVIYQNI